MGPDAGVVLLMGISLRDLSPTLRQRVMHKLADQRPVPRLARGASKRSELVEYVAAMVARLAPDLGQPVRELAFAREPVPGLLIRGRKWRWDLAWPVERVAIEVHGATHGRRVVCHQCGVTVRARKNDGSTGGMIMSGGRHTQGVGFQRDREKVAIGQALGWRVLELSGRVIREPDAWLRILRYMMGGER